jgi:DNA-binding NarL/FixJ family response regulator
MITIAIIEDDEVVRNTVSSFLSRETDFNCVIIASSVDDFMAKSAKLVQLDIVLTDIGLPGMNGIEAIPLLRKKFPDVSVVMLSVYIDSDHIFKALCAGAVGYLQKDTPLEDVVDSLKVIHKGGSAMSPAIARKVVDYFAPKRTYNEPLTAKERQVIAAMVEGCSYKMIAHRLGIGLETVRHHIKNIYRKLHVNSKGEVIVKSMKGEI